LDDGVGVLGHAHGRIAAGLADQDLGVEARDRERPCEDDGLAPRRADPDRLGVRLAFEGLEELVGVLGALLARPDCAGQDALEVGADWERLDVFRCQWL
jgi:hypothetical protein